MTQKEKVINAIKNCDFDSLDKLLDNEISYQEVPKSVFINQLKEEIQYRNIEKFDSVITGGVCKGCECGSQVIRFHKERIEEFGTFYVLDLIITGNETIKNIRTCASNSFQYDPDNIFEIYLLFYNEQHIDFSPSFEYLRDKDKIDLALSELLAFKNEKPFYLKQYFEWFEKHKIIIGLEDDIFGSDNFELYWRLNSYYLSKIYSLKEILSNCIESNFESSNPLNYNELSSLFSNIDFTFISDSIYSFNISNNENLKLDVSGFKEVFKFIENYKKTELNFL